MNNLSGDDITLRAWSIPAQETSSLRVQLSIKRLLDILCAVFLLLLLFPVLIVAAVCVRLSSKGPIFYKQERYGWRGSRFTCLKFRSTLVNYETTVERQQHGNRPSIHERPRTHVRFTGLGGWLRRTSIDELPQLLNVLKGEMSLVGPRPLELCLLDPYPEFHAVRDRVRPGITGLWQISARDPHATAFDMMPYDLEYISKVTLWLDFKILLKTPSIVLLGKGAR